MVHLVAICESFNGYSINGYSIRESIGDMLLRLCCTVEGSEYGLWAAEVVVDYVDKSVRFHDVGNKCLARRAVFIDSGPLHSEFECLVLYMMGQGTFQVERSKLAFQAMKLTASTMVGCTISFPGKTPQVTALGPSLWVFVRRSPRLLIA